jgi:putative sterol carrier protein
MRTLRIDQAEAHAFWIEIPTGKLGANKALTARKLKVKGNS